MIKLERVKIKHLRSVNLLLGFLILIAGSSIVSHSPVSLYDLITGLQVSDFSITWPRIRFFIEPLYSFAFYVLTIDKSFYKPVLISWTVWVLSATLVCCLLNKRSVRQTINNLFYLLMILFTIFFAVALVPIPGPKLEKPEGYIAIDTHSHTLRSHDNVAPAYISLKAHLWQGFDVFFNTEHGHTKGFAAFPENIKYKTVYPGMQIQTTDRVSVVLLSPKEFDGKDYKDMTLADIIKKAHENKMFVIMPHWWKWRRHTFANLRDFGIDGFEIYNCGYRNFDKVEQKAMINFAKENNIAMFGVTDWHGWGYMSDVWTVVKGRTSENIEEQIAKKSNTKVILYRQEQSGSIMRFIFEPFSAFYYYVKNANFKYLISFMFWIILVFLILKSSFFKYVKKYLPVVMSAIFAASAVYFYAIVRTVLDTNTIVMESIVPSLIGFCLLWLILWRSNDKISL
ncbi:MAG: hypothetical protein LE180_01245 [Endomicrobium sp.]|uniref:PHP domain-containing protein n=1 Tax=Candidatus Endomicrobiellum pyrsonymphae TaxID=1408203 RepID=UPI0035786D8D|nr:hypothetical protein [Endomicrobium sp.]